MSVEVSLAEGVYMECEYQCESERESASVECM